MTPKPEEKWYLLALICAALALLSAPTIIGPVVFLALGAAATIQGYRVEKARENADVSHASD